MVVLFVNNKNNPCHAAQISCHISFSSSPLYLWIISFPGVSNFCNDVHMMVGKQPNIYLKATLVVIMPIIIIVRTILSYYVIALHNTNVPLILTGTYVYGRARAGRD